MRRQVIVEFAMQLGPILRWQIDNFSLFSGSSTTKIMNVEHTRKKM